MRTTTVVWAIVWVFLFLMVGGCSDSSDDSGNVPSEDGDETLSDGDTDDEGLSQEDGDEQEPAADGDDTDGEWVFNRDDYETIHGWILLDNDPQAVVETIETASRFGVNHIELSHDIIMNIDEIMGEDASVQTRVDTINQGIAKAHEKGMKAFIWVHELSEMGFDVCYDPTEPIWETRKQGYRDALAKIPDVDGLVLMFGSAPSPPWYTICSCDYCLDAYGDSLSMPNEEKVRIITEEIGGVLVNELGKELLMRTFVHEPQELDWHGLGLTSVRGVDFTGMHKSDVQDWQPYNPFHANVGNVGNHPSVMEFDLAGEYFGRSELPWCAPDFYQYRMRYLWNHKGIGAVSRVQRGSDHALGTPNEVNLLAMQRLMEDIDTPLEDIWKEFMQSFYGLDADGEPAQTLIAILKDTFPIRRKSHYALGIWALEKSSDIPADLTMNQFRDRGEMPKWDADYQDLYDALSSPDKQTVLWLWQEGTESVELAERSVARFETMKDALSEAHRKDLTRRLKHQLYAAKVWRDVDLVLWGAKAMAASPEDTELPAWVNFAVEDLALVHQAMIDDGLSDVSLVSPSRIEAFRQAALSKVTSGVAAQEPLGVRFAPLDIRLVSDTEAEVTIHANVAVSVNLDSGTEMPDYGTTQEVALSGEAPQAVVTLQNLEAKTRYVVRVRAQKDGVEYRGGDFWISTP